MASKGQVLAPPPGTEGAPPPQPQGPPQTPTLTYVDFSPICLKSPSFGLPTYEPFQVLMQRGNDWLRQNPHYRVKTCESIESKAQNFNYAVDTVTSGYHQGTLNYIYTRSLRMWVIPKGPSDPPEPQQVGYLNFVPACLSAGGFLKSPDFERFDVTIQKINTFLQQTPIQGHVLNLETQDIKFESWDSSYDPDRTSWLERSKGVNFYVWVSRLFYEVGAPAYEEIGCADFIPGMVQAGSLFTPDSHEPLCNVAAQANNWIRQQQGIRVTNIQSINFKNSRQSWGGGGVDTMRSFYYDHSNSTIYLRILRVCFVRSTNYVDPSVSPLPQFSYRTFGPAQTSTGAFGVLPTYETQPQNMARVQAWLRHTGARIVSAETVEVFSQWGGGMYGTNPEHTITWDTAGGQYVIFMIRIYLDGAYSEPPPEVLPPVPVVQPSQGLCCTLL